MNTTATDRKATKVRTARVECCNDATCASGLRNNYFAGKRLTPDSFHVEQEYLVERRRLINRAIHGWGVVYGFPVAMAAPNQCRNETVSGRLEIGPGLALDRLGRELLQTEPTVLEFRNVIMLDDQGGRIAKLPDCDSKEGNDDRFETGCWLLGVHYAEQYIDPVPLKDPCTCERREWDRICETVRYSLRRIDCEKCCAEQPCELDCHCGPDPCCGQRGTTTGYRDPNAKSEARSSSVTRGGCRCLCDHLTHLDPGADCSTLCEIEEPCALVRVDLRNEVPLACVALRRDECGKWAFDPWIEDCGPRRFVKRNDLLFDLIRGCDLTYISWISWADWHRGEVDFDAFADYFAGPDTNGGTLTKFTVRFSRPVKRETVTPDCFAMTAMFHEKEGGWREVLRVPIVGVHAEDTGGLTTEATLIARTKWVRDAILGAETRFDNYGAQVEIEIRGDYILDCNGQAVDANAVGLRAVPTGNGTPGDTYLSAFRVHKRDLKDTESTY